MGSGPSSVAVSSRTRREHDRIGHRDDPRVRLRAAQGLVFGKEKSAVPVLINLLTEPAPEIAAQAEELLLFVAAEQAPSLLGGDSSPQGQQQYRAGWAAWWRQHEREMSATNCVTTSHDQALEAGYARQREAPAVTGADETRPEHHTRRDMTS